MGRKVERNAESAHRRKSRTSEVTPAKTESKEVTEPKRRLW
jgi:hypothetical protein